MHYTHTLLSTADLAADAEDNGYAIRYASSSTDANDQESDEERLYRTADAMQAAGTVHNHTLYSHIINAVTAGTVHTLCTIHYTQYTIHCILYSYTTYCTLCSRHFAEALLENFDDDYEDADDDAYLDADVQLSDGNVRMGRAKGEEAQVQQEEEEVQHDQLVEQEGRKEMLETAARDGKWSVSPVCILCTTLYITPCTPLCTHYTHTHSTPIHNLHDTPL
jgi:hypothetical protein